MRVSLVGEAVRRQQDLGLGPLLGTGRQVLQEGRVRDVLVLAQVVAVDAADERPVVERGGRLRGVRVRGDRLEVVGADLVPGVAAVPGAVVLDGEVQAPEVAVGRHGREPEFGQHARRHGLALLRVRVAGGAGEGHLEAAVGHRPRPDPGDVARRGLAELEPLPQIGPMEVRDDGRRLRRRPARLERVLAPAAEDQHGHDDAQHDEDAGGDADGPARGHAVAVVTGAELKHVTFLARRRAAPRCGARRPDRGPSR